MENPQATVRAYYLDDFADEIIPCDATLEGWAEWLSRHDPDWPHDIPKKGDIFIASVLRFDEDLIATRKGDDWTFSRGLDGEPSLLAVRFGPGLGWSPDNIIYPCTLDAVKEWLSDAGEATEEIEHVAVAYDEPQLRLIYAENPPRLLVQGTVQ